jgi:hypothetical protein
VLSRSIALLFCELCLDTGLVSARKCTSPVGIRRNVKDGRSVTTDILMNIIAENHSGVVQRFDKSGINGLSFQCDPETWDITTRVRYLYVTVKYANENALVPP